MSSVENLLIAKGLSRVFLRGAEEVRALDSVSLEIRAGEYVAFVGPSGSGKTTLLNILGCLDNPTSGSLSIDGQEVFGLHKPMSERLLTKIRRQAFGYIFQQFYLIPTLTVLENVEVPPMFVSRGDRSKSDIRNEAIKILDTLGMKSRIHHLPKELSGGEMQRVAIARALINTPKILLADEPTGNLDSVRSSEIGQIFKTLNKNMGLTIILVTHNIELAKEADRVVSMRDGKIIAV